MSDQTPPRLGIGHRVWIRSEQYRRRFRPLVITAETTRSWLAGGRGQYKIPKGTTTPTVDVKADHDHRTTLWLTDEAMERDIWINNRYKLAQLLQECEDVEKLRQVAELLGYQEER